MENATYTNELSHETSPYLLQHAHNPVQWHPWGEAAITKAKESDLPILVSIGYSACHWCHVMERESFENEEVAAYMNEHFINIKIDREERPDLDHIYMDAVQAITGSGGWPLNVFLTTDLKPFYGGTYFPPQKAFNRASWKDVLIFMTDAWQNRRDEIEQQAETLAKHISEQGNLFSGKKMIDVTTTDTLFSKESCHTMGENMLKSADLSLGGFGNAPKFPQTFSIQYLLAYGHFFNNRKAIDHANFSLKQLINGGIYDQLAGGMARYSTDSAWLAPHFEKMLYDNALLVSVLSDAYQLTKDPFYKSAIEKTLQFFIDEMQHPDGGYYAAMDADSEGIEGKYYVWDKEELDTIIGEDAALVCQWFGVTEKGNWEHKNILHITQTAETFAIENNISVEALQAKIDHAVTKLLVVRNKRIRPATDDKIILGWNALLLTAFCKAASALGNPLYTSKAISLYSFLKEKFSRDGTIVYHTYKNNVARHPAFLDDYACLIQACILLQEITSDQSYLSEAERMTEQVIGQFGHAEGPFFYYTHQDQQDIILRKTEMYDGAVPSGNSIMAGNLLYLSIVLNRPDWADRANSMLSAMGELVQKYPTSFGVWAMEILKRAVEPVEIIVTGKNLSTLLPQILAEYLPHKIIQSAMINQDFPLFQGKEFGDESRIFICKNYGCQPPVNSLAAMLDLLKYPY
jgi:uncharacterized protein YyaL (SSP411 family)